MFEARDYASMAAPMPKQRILVTGGAGFIGSNFCNTHCEKYDVVALDNFFLGDSSHLRKEVTFVKGDATDHATLDALGTFDEIVHFGGTTSAPMFINDIVGGYRNSIVAFLEVLEFANRTGVKRVLFASTSSLYGNLPPPLSETQTPLPTNHYSVTKIAMEHIAECYQKTHPAMDIIGFRFMSIYGPNEEHKGIYANLISQFAWAMMRGEQPIVYGDGTQTRDFTNVLDVVQGITRAMEHPKPLGFQIFNIGTGKSVNLLEVIGFINEALGTSIEPKHIENPVKETYIRTQLADISKIQTMLGYKPSVPLKDGIRTLVEAAKNPRKLAYDRRKEANVIPK